VGEMLLISRGRSQRTCSDAARGYGEREPAHVIAAGSWLHTSPPPIAAPCVFQGSFSCSARFWFHALFLSLPESPSHPPSRSAAMSGCP